MTPTEYAKMLDNSQHDYAICRKCDKRVAYCNTVRHYVKYDDGVTAYYRVCKECCK